MFNGGDRLSLHECEGIASHLLRLARMDGCENVDPLVVAHLLGVKLSPKAPKGCHGHLELDPIRLRFDGRGSEQVVTHRIGHELGHLAAVLCGIDGLHESDVDLIADAVLMPRCSVVRALAEVGQHPWRLMTRFQSILPSRLFARVALTADLVAVLRLGNSRQVVANDIEPLEVSMREYVLFHAVRTTGEPANDRHGGIAAPFCDPGQRGGIVSLLARR